MTDSKYFTTTKKGEIFELKSELNNDKKEKKKEAVKKVIASMTVGKDVSALFPDVVNCMQTDNLELKKLVYLYLMNYAKSQPDMAIMAVNTFVKVSSLSCRPQVLFLLTTFEVFSVLKSQLSCPLSSLSVSIPLHFNSPPCYSFPFVAKGLATFTSDEGNVSCVENHVTSFSENRWKQRKLKVFFAISRGLKQPHHRGLWQKNKSFKALSLVYY